MTYFSSLSICLGRLYAPTFHLNLFCTCIVFHNHSPVPLTSLQLVELSVTFQVSSLQKKTQRTPFFSFLLERNEKETNLSSIYSPSCSVEVSPVGAGFPSSFPDLLDMLWTSPVLHTLAAPFPTLSAWLEMLLDL